MAEDFEVGSIGVGDCENEIVKRSPLIFKNLNRAKDYLTPKAWLAFTQFKKAFTKALIFRQFDLEYHIQIETNVSSYAIGKVLSQLTLDNLGWWHPVAF